VNKQWRNAGLYALLALVVVALATAFFDKQPQTRETWRYSQLIQAVENKRVAKVSISADRSFARLTDPDDPKGKTVIVNIPNDPELINF